MPSGTWPYGSGGRRACLMCMEADPDQCHRKHTIASRLKHHGILVTHLTG